MTRYITVLFLLLLCRGAVQGQCYEEGCASIPGVLIDYCCKNPDFPGRCAQFTEDSPQFYFQYPSRKGVPVNFTLPAAGVSLDAWLLTFENNKTYKFSPADYLFLRFAATTWLEMESLRKWDLKKVAAGMTVTGNGLAYKFLKQGNGKLPEKGKKVTVHYTGYLENGEKFDSSLDRKQAFSFQLGAKQVIEGWDTGVALMPVGSKVLLRIPPAMGYGARAMGSIPPNSVLYFVIEIISAE